MTSRNRLQQAPEHTCWPTEHCTTVSAGHALHAVQLHLAASTPDRWVDALVAGVHGEWVEARTLDGEAVELWNHGDLVAAVQAGDPVTVHADYKVLCAGARRFSVLVRPSP